jgi:pimeloyl-ACP methyl ester carboxylesterase
VDVDGTGSSLLAMPWGPVEVLHGGEGPPLVVLHRDLGNLGWGPLHERLARHHSVCAPSLPGFGGSALPEWVRTVGHLATLTGRVLDRVGTGAVPVVGLGFGGWVAAELAAQSPGRVDGLVLVSPMGVRPDDGEIVDQFLYGAADYACLGFADPETFVRQIGSTDDDVVAANLDRSRETLTRVAWKPVGHDRALPGLLSAVSIAASIVWGGADAVVPVGTARRWCDLLGAGEPVVVAGGGHHVELERPDEVADAVLDFLSARTAVPVPNRTTGGPPCS